MVSPNPEIPVVDSRSLVESSSDDEHLVKDSDTVPGMG
eukprot:CAMPEP_0175075240 /NCGR_PEP_ID=MMETSP0052_2-20121109/21859_1 /TAXON_ID=51329 ORGANISM="Polytomella parva, Strain SAG 63-3" /NCGR_SAMPLE_ID=MMETSP0052_2 /ASSEMBLY_ACC=CAM_ASM_000194 /LENGTH=37 /DNA_ID= /DNA_START= /DNA_END= /DNA_ORIENTATION=